MINYDSRVVMPDTICRSRFPVITRFHDYITRTKGLIDMEFSQEFFPFLTICQPTDTYDVAPPIRLIGRQSEQRKLFGDDWGKQVTLVGQTPDPNLEKLSAYGYEYAVENGVFCQECEALIELSDGLRFVPFLRYIARYRDPGGRELIAFASSHLNPTWQ